MESSTKSIIAVCSIITAVAVDIMRKEQQHERVRSRRDIWSHKWLLRRDSGLGLSSMVMNELRLEDPKAFQNFVRMSYATFSELLEKVYPLIERQNTEMREAIYAPAR